MVQAIRDGPLKVGSYGEDHKLMCFSNGINEVVRACHPPYLQGKPSCPQASHIMLFRVENVGFKP